MRRLAEQLAAIGQQVGTAGKQVNKRAAELEFEGPAARRLNAWAAQQVEQTNRTVVELNDLAIYLQRKAAELEARHPVAKVAKG